MQPISSPDRDARNARRALLHPPLIGALALLLTTHTSGRAQDGNLYDDEHVPRIEMVFPIDDWHQRLVDNYLNGNVDFVEADLLVDGVLYPSVGVQHKGDASYQGNSVRENFKITVDAFVPGQEVQSYDILTLDAGRQSSVFTELAALWLMEDFQETPEVNLAHVLAGTDTKTEDLGVFTNTERVDKRFVRTRFGVDGHRYEPKLTADAFEYLGDTWQDYRKDFKRDGGDPNTKFEDLKDACVALENASQADLRQSVAPFMDLDVCMRNLIGARMSGNFDSMLQGNNYYLCEEVIHGSRMVPVFWDLDLAWEDFHPDPIPDEDNQLPLAKIFGSTVEMERAHSFVRHYLQAGFGKNALRRYLLDRKAQVLPLILGSPHDDLKSEDDVDAALDYAIVPVREIRKTLEADPLYQRELPTFLLLEHDPLEPQEGDTVTVRVEPILTTSAIDEVLLWSRITGHFVDAPMFDDGAHDDGAAGDGVYGATLPAAQGGDVIEYYVEVRPVDLGAAGYGFEPVATEFEPRTVPIGVTAGDLRLNEAVADNENGDLDEAGDADDWFEIFNRSTQDLDIGETFFSDDPLDPRKWQVPVGTVVPAGGFLRFWADDEPGEGPFHATFKLSKDGETLRWTGRDVDGNPLWDEVRFPAMTADRSYGRLLDGEDLWFHLGEPSGAAPTLPPGAWQSYDTRGTGAPSGLVLSASGNAKVGETLTLALDGGTPHGIALLFFGLAPADLDAGALGPFLLDPSFLFRLVLRFDGQGHAQLTATVPVELADLVFFVQGLEHEFCNALAVRVEP